MAKQGQPADDPSSAPESGTVRDETSGNKPSDRNNRGETGSSSDQSRTGAGNAPRDDPSKAGEEP